ncbi:MAG: helix-turn-helix domain-containing protein [Candidatus Korobacteraceae bacterium]
MTLKEMFLGMPASERSRMFLTVKEAASILAKKASSVRRMIDEDKLKGVKVGGTWWVYRPSLEELVQDS